MTLQMRRELRSSVILLKQGEDEKLKASAEASSSPGTGVLPVWRARCITSYNPELLPPEAEVLPEEVIVTCSLAHTRARLLSIHVSFKNA